MPAHDAAVNVPQALKQLRRWCRWHLLAGPGGKPTKRPDRSTRHYQSNAATFEEALQLGELTSEAGVGLIFTDGVQIGNGAWLYALDLDACRDPSTAAIAEWAQRVVAAFDYSYHEVSPSGTGLRMFVTSRERLALQRSKVDVDEEPLGTTTKRPNLQVFGAGAPSYVTVTGARAPQSALTIATFEDLGWLVETFGLGAAEATSPPLLPTGDGPPPSAAEIRAAVSAMPHGEQLLAGDWETVTPDASASEAYARLVQMVLRATRGHGPATVQFLLTCTAWGRGDIENSADASRYSRRDWVERDVARVARRMPAPTADVFGDVPAPPPAASLLMPLSELHGLVETDAFLVYRVLPVRGLAQFFGDPGCGKTPFALSLSLHIAGGLSTWFGHEIERHGPVVYMIGEDTAGIAARSLGECKRLGLDPKAIPWFATRRPARLSDPQDVVRWIAAVRQQVGQEQVALVVVDTQASNFGDGDENSTADMIGYVNCCNALVRELGCLVLLVHHTGHGAKDRARGSSVLIGGLDACYEIARMDTVVQATSRKAKNWGEPAPLIGSLEVVELMLDRKGRAVTAVTLKDTPPEPAAAFGTEGDVDPMIELLREIQRSAGRALAKPQLAKALRMAEGGQRLRGLLDRGEVDLRLFDSHPVGKSTRSGRKYFLTQKGVAALAAAENERKSKGDDKPSSDSSLWS